MSDNSGKMSFGIGAVYLADKKIEGGHYGCTFVKEKGKGNFIPQNLYRREGTSVVFPSSWVRQVILFLVLGIFLAPVSGVKAQAILTVNSNADTSDTNPGDGVCEDNLGNCTLRATVEEANASSGPHNILLPAVIIPLEKRITVASEMAISGAGASFSMIDNLIDVAVFEVEDSSLSVSGIGFVNSGEIADCIYLTLSNSSFWVIKHKDISFTPNDPEITHFLSQKKIVPGDVHAVLSGFPSQDISVKLGIGSVSKLSGDDRFATAAAISAATFNLGVPAVYIAIGENFPDAFAGGAAAAKSEGPILLVLKDSLSSATSAELSRLLPQDIFVLGGTAAISASVATQLEPFTTGNVTRLSGPDRFATAAEMSAATLSSG